MKLRKRYLPVAAVLGAAVAIVPALAAAGSTAPSEAKLEVNENCYLHEWPCWNVEGNNPENIRNIQPITIAQGGTISFKDNDSKAPTDVIWTGAARPSCTGVVEAPPTSTGWSGTCTFANAGEYEFESQGLFDEDGFNYTKYRVIVEKPGGGTTTGTTTTTTTTPTATSTTPTTPTAPTTPATPTTPTTPGTPTATTSTQPYGGGATTTATPGSTEMSPSQGGGSPIAKLALANPQHGDAVHGTVQIPAADGGARLEVELLAQGASLAKVKRGGRSRVGRLVRSSAPAGTVSFTVSLDARAKRALRRHHKLALTLKIVLTPKHGAAMNLTRSLVVR